MFAGTSPTLGPAHDVPENAPPSPPFSAQYDPLDDIYGSEPSSPNLAPRNGSNDNHTYEERHEILSDLPSRQRAIDTDAYREGLSNSKGQYVQEGFDEGYSLGANLGQRVGYILGVLQGFVTACRGHDEVRWREVKELWESAKTELAIEKLLGQAWVDEEGIFKWEVKGAEDEPTFREVADQHPDVKRWMGKVQEMARAWGVDLRRLEREEGDAEDNS